jgi:predicted AlkP superfamily phosphohydrolase/phosphomutase
LASKVVFIGIDSADYSQIKRMSKNDELPNIRKFENFFLGRLQAPIPPHTAPSWTSMLTGTNPGKHGIFYFKDILTDKLVSSLDVSTRYVWELIGTKGKGSIVVNVPLTYPVRPFNGIMISGVHAIKADATSVYPQSIIPQVARDYKFDLQGINLFYSFSKDPKAACARLLDDEESRADLFCRLLQENPWDFACIVLTSLDRIQHYAWGMKSESDPVSVYVANAYHRMDKLVGTIMESVSDYQDCVTLLTSDHGFEDKTNTVYVNTILAKAGLLTPRSLTDKFESKITDFSLNTVAPKIPKKLATILIRVADRLTPLFPGLLSGTNRFDVPPIDYSRTQAYAYSYGLVAVNLKGRNVSGIVSPKDKEKVASRVAQALAVSLSQSGIKPRILSANHYYSGLKIDKAPDLVIEPIEGCYFSCNVNSDVTDSKTEGEHSTLAVLGAIGKDIQRTSKPGIPEVWDVGASILSLLGFEVPTEIDGKPLFLSGGINTPTESIVYESSNPAAEASGAYSLQEEEQIAKRLKDMGYE